MRAELEPERAVIGFCGGPFTVAGYLVEGRPSRDFVRTKSLMYGSPEVWHALMDRLADQFAALRRGEGGRGRGRDPALRLVGRRALAAGLPRVRRAVLARGSSRRSTCRRSTSAPASRRRCSRRWRATGGDAIGLDWRTPLDAGWRTRRRGEGRPGEPRPGDAARAVGAGRGGRARRARPRGRPPGPRLQPRPRRPAADRSRRGHTARGARPRADAAAPRLTLRLEGLGGQLPSGG